MGQDARRRLGRQAAQQARPPRPGHRLRARELRLRVRLRPGQEHGQGEAARDSRQVRDVPGGRGPVHGGRARVP